MKDLVYIRNGKRYKIYKLVDKDTSVMYYEVGDSENKIISSIEYWSDNFEREFEQEPLGFWESRARVKELAEMDNQPMDNWDVMDNY